MKIRDLIISRICNNLDIKYINILYILMSQKNINNQQDSSQIKELISPNKETNYNTNAMESFTEKTKTNATENATENANTTENQNVTSTSQTIIENPLYLFYKGFFVLS